ncbi:hypothetical protein HanPSC8_Chr04g0184371 [Helianthus annuus]|nr:hypothetical protein HanPSC8_Chr04g0184371 [Helianthus annuus]
MKGLDPVTSYEFDTDDIDETGYYCSCFVPEQLRRFAIDIDEQTD